MKINLKPQILNPNYYPKKLKIFWGPLYYLLAVIAVLVLTVSGKASAELTIKANHDHIKIDFFYHGDEVTVSGTSDAGVDLMVKITSPETHLVMKKKGKVAGLLWMNVGTLNFEHTPNLYFLHSTRGIEELLAQEEMDKEIIGYDALMKHVGITPIENDYEREKWFKEFVRFKEDSRLYNIASGDITVTEAGNRQEYFIKLPWPYQAQPGEYTITVYAIRDKRISEKAEAKVLVEQVGGVEVLADMAKNNGALYGIISIVVAVAAGFGVGMIFRKGGSH